MKQLLFLAAIALCVPAFLFGQGDAGTGGPPPPPMHRGFGTGPEMGPLGMGMSRKVVTGLPYSADVITTMVQTLADGNTINRTESGRVARDSQGRVYMQQNIVGGPWAQKGGMKVTFLSDPVGGYTYILNAKDKIAIRREFHSHDGERPEREPRASSPDAAHQTEADLGQQTLGGLLATGKSHTRVIPAGAIGNSQPISEKSEIWTSPDLQIVLLAKHSDPRMGQMTYALTDIQRAEPNAALFQVPADYTVKDAPFPGEHGPR